MAKTKEQKDKLVDYLKTNLGEKRAAVLVNYQGLKVKEIEALRNKLGDKGIKFSVVKNTLFKLALKDHKFELDREVLTKPLAISFSDDEVEVSKEITAGAKDAEAMEIVGGFVGGEFVTAETISQLSKLPGREELYAKLVGTLNAPISGLVNVMAGSIRALVNVLNNYKEKIA